MPKSIQLRRVSWSVFKAGVSIYPCPTQFVALSGKSCPTLPWTVRDYCSCDWTCARGWGGPPGSPVGWTDLAASCLLLQCGSSPGAAFQRLPQGAAQQRTDVLRPFSDPALDSLSPPCGAASAPNSFLNTHP